MSVTLLEMIVGNPTSNVGTSGTIRYYASKDFTALDSTEYKGGVLDSKDYFLSNTWSASGGLLTVPAKTGFPTTSDAWPNSARITAGIYDSKGIRRGTLFENCIIPANPSLPLTLLYLQTVSVASQPVRSTETLRKDEFLLLLDQATQAALGTLNDANSLVKGRTFLSDDPLVASSPKAWGINAKRLPTLTTPVYWASQYTSFNAAVTAIGSAQATLIVSELMTGVTTASVPSTLTLRREGAGGLSIVTGQILTVQGPIDSDPVQFFFNALSGQGTISFTGNKSIPQYYPQWWGAKGDWSGSAGTDNLAAFNAAVAAVPKGVFNLTVPGDYRLSDSWEVNKSNITVLTAPGVTIRTTADTSGGETVVFRGLVGNLLTNVHITGGGTVTNTSGTPLADNGIGFNLVDGFSCTGMRVVNVTRAGITAQTEVFNGLIADNYVEGADFIGISVAQAGPNQLRNHIIRNNIVKTTGDSGSGYAGIYVDSGDDVILSGNLVDTVTGAVGRGISIQNGNPSFPDNHVTLIGNRVLDTDGVGIFGFDITDLTAIGNTSKNAGSHGLYFEDCTDVSLSGNQSLTPAARGISVVNATGAVRINGEVVKTSGEDGVFVTGAGMTSLSIAATIEGAGGADAAGLTYSAVFVNNTPLINHVNVIVTGTKHRYAVRNDGANLVLISGNVTPGNTATFTGTASWKNSGVSISGVPLPGKPQATPSTPTTATTLTVANLMIGILTATPIATGATVVYTLPTGTNMETGGNFFDNDSFDWSITNLAAAAADTITITANTGHTIVGNPIVQSAHATTGGITGNSAVFRSRKISATVWVTYRIS